MTKQAIGKTLIEIAAGSKISDLGRKKSLAERFREQVRPRASFLLPQPIIGEAVALLKDGSIVNCRYGPDCAALVSIAGRST